MERNTPFQAFVLALFAGTLLCCPLAPARADDVDLQQLLHGRQRCDHVIGLLMRHGVNNDTDGTAGINTFHPLGPICLSTEDLGDLQLVSITRLEAATPGCGPTFDVVIKNCSGRDVCGFRTTLVALFGRICPTSPNVTVQVDSIPAGQAMQVSMTLPIESLAMGNLNGQPLAMNRVLLVVDSFDQFLESDEANNLRVFDFAAIPVAAATVEVTSAVGVTTENASGMQMSETVDAQPVAAAPVAPAQAMEPTTAQDPPNDPSANPADPTLRSAIDQFTEEATIEQDAS